MSTKLCGVANFFLARIVVFAPDGESAPTDFGRVVSLGCVV